MRLQKEFYSKLSSDKIKINWNKNPIEMKLFLSFLKVDVERSRDHLGYDTGWTQLNNIEHKLIIGGGIVNSVEYLDRLQYGKKLSNPYNDYVNPFYLWEILNNKGRTFFLEYYKKEIDAILQQAEDKIEQLKKQLSESEILKKELLKEVESLHKKAKLK